MGKNEDGHFWGMVIAFASLAIAGAVALTRSFRTSRDGGRTWEELGKEKDQAKAKKNSAHDGTRNP